MREKTARTSKVTHSPGATRLRARWIASIEPCHDVPASSRAGSGGDELLVAGVAGLVAGAMSMAAGEYVSVSSQSDTERADVERERGELATQPEFEKRELEAIYVARGLTPDLARHVAQQLMVHDALGAHMRDEFGLSDAVSARPVQAGFTSAASFAVGAALPVVVSLLAPIEQVR
jgi:VIT1/CCC1 family predicted Fe2+/Mn2+ transporter